MHDTKRLFRTLALSNFFLYLGFNLWQALFNNFAVEELAVNASQIGFIQAVREIPGLLGFVLGFLALIMSEMRIMGLSVLLTGLGLIISGGAHNLATLLVGTTVMSIGFHFFYPSNASLVLMTADEEDAPKVLGRLGSVAALAAVLGTLVVWVFVDGLQAGPLNIPAWGYRNTLYVTGAVVVVGSFFSQRNGQYTAAQHQKRKVIFRREYWLYYVLTFLMGSRRHIFTTFAIFLLVQVYGISVRETAMLFLINNLINSYAASLLGRLVARFGERRVLTVNFVGLIGVFLGYAFIPYLPVLYVLFVMDNVFFGFSLAVDTYFQKIARSPEEITSNVSMAQTVNHISALVVPILGGILWTQISPAATFLAGVIIVLVALALVQLIRTQPAPMPAAVPLD
jgi:MFS family permease